MNDIAISNLTKKERKKIKTIINTIKKGEENNKTFYFFEQKQNELYEKAKRNKEKRIKCFEENKIRKIDNQTFDNLMNKYELEEYELDVEIFLLEKNIKLKKNYLKRLDYLYLILAFYDGITTMIFNNKKIYLDDAYKLFFSHVIEEEKEMLEIDHKIMQLYMLINNKKDNYLSDEEKNKIYINILENRTKSLEIKNDFLEVDIDSIIVNDFFDMNIDNVYEHIWGYCRIPKKN